jgi:hypothetical protein
MSTDRRFQNREKIKMLKNDVCHEEKMGWVVVGGGGVLV